MRWDTTKGVFDVQKLVVETTDHVEIDGSEGKRLYIQRHHRTDDPADSLEVSSGNSILLGSCGPRMRTILKQTTPDDFEHQFVRNLLKEESGQKPWAQFRMLRVASLIQDFNRVVAGAVANESERVEDIIRLGLFLYYNKDRSQVHYAGQNATSGSHNHAYLEIQEFGILCNRPGHWETLFSGHYSPVTPPAN
ncbi:hypothetical protein B0H14DRAFT_2559549 [Mycena olivaceomarginata]|nr:hypothetical protein B0H14DRAFT_2559549 [Mycena olivaceomarginata]